MHKSSFIGICLLASILACPAFAQQPAKRWKFGRPGDSLVEARLYGGIHTSKAMDVNVHETMLERNHPNPFAWETTL
ncbi:MAG: hypothetical protein F4146_02270 [Rhodothermaceae bacterium]|nr:hypothetical protein [Rhodothermaceae bacterium]MYF40891.1 hypothetical protein [Rhodothermaceae bacterium]MYH07389.1 hypothetical protein [Rhodothermaceae bacterium]